MPAVNKKMVENEMSKKRKSSSKGLRRNQSTESDADYRSQRKRRTTKNSSSRVDEEVSYNRRSGGTNGRGEKDKFNHFTISAEPERLLLCKWLTMEEFMV